MKIYLNIYKNRSVNKKGMVGFELFDSNGQKIGGFDKCRIGNDIDKSQLYVTAKNIIKTELGLAANEYKLVTEIF